MAGRPLLLASESYEAATPISAIQRIVNLYPEKNPEGSEFPFTLYSAPGLKAFTTAGSGPIRGMCPMGAILFVVSGNELYTVTILGATTLVGTINGTGAVRMTTNGTHVVIFTTNEAYVATASSIALLPESGLNGAAYQDGYGIYTQANTQNVLISGLDDLTTIDPIGTTADASYDNVVGCISDHRELFVFKEKTTEVYNNTGAAAFPFERSLCGFLERGCACAGSITKADNRVFWLGDDLGVYQMVGYQPQRISTPGIDFLVESLYSPTTAEGFVLSYFGHVFYCLVFSDRAILYDLTTGKWCERESYGLGGRWRVSCHADIWGKQILGDYANGELYELDESTYDEDGDPLIRTVISPHLDAEGGRAVLSEVNAIFEPGVGLVTGQGSDPQVGLCWSDDDGRSWSNNRYAQLGAIGENEWQVRFNRLGQFRRRSLKMFVSDPVKVAITGMYVRMEAQE